MQYNNIIIQCKTTIDDEVVKWNATLKSIKFYHDFYEAIIEGRGSSLNIIVGSTNQYNWIAIPNYGVSVSLSYFNDLFWNEEKLSSVIGNIDGATVSYALSFIESNRDLLIDNDLENTKIL